MSHEYFWHSQKWSRLQRQVQQYFIKGIGFGFEIEKSIYQLRLSHEFGIKETAQSVCQLLFMLINNNSRSYIGCLISKSYIWNRKLSTGSENSQWIVSWNSIIHQQILPSLFPLKRRNCWSASSGAIRTTISNMWRKNWQMWWFIAGICWMSWGWMKTRLSTPKWRRTKPNIRWKKPGAVRQSTINWRIKRVFFNDRTNH